MTHLLLPVASAFLAAPNASGRRGSLPERSDGLPVLFLLFCIACAAISILETFWPAVAVAVSAIEAVIVPQL